MSDSHPVARHYEQRYERRVPGSWGRSEREDATHIVIQFRDGPYRPEIVIPMGEDEDSRGRAEHQAEQTRNFMVLAFDRGDKAARADIRRALGVVDPMP